VRCRASLADLGKIIPEACGTVWNVVRALKVKGAGRHVALYWDEVFNLEVGVELEVPFAGQSEVVVSKLPGGTVATAVHFGPYNLLPEAHQAIRGWCTDQGYELAGPNWEMYDHWKHEWCDEPAKIRTDVYYLLKGDS
jgi:effector-binding domain-containing protein